MRTAARGGSACLFLLILMTAPVPLSAESLVWSRIFPAGHRMNLGRGVAIGPTGHVAVVGEVKVVPPSANWIGDIFLRTYTPGGVPLWTKRYNGNYDTDGAGGVAVGPDGSVAIAGYTVRPEGVQLLVQKYSATGTILWTRTYHEAYYGSDGANGVAVGPDGSLYVTGWTSVEGQYYDLILLKYSPEGSLLWTATFDGPLHSADVGDAVAVGPDGSVYVSGYLSPGDFHSYDLLLLKYSAEGSLLWTATYNGPASGWDEGRGVAVAPDGSVYVAGTTDFQTADSGLLLLKYTPDGSRLWSATFEGAAGSYDDAYGVAVAADGNVFVVGATSVDAVTQERDLLLLKYSPEGAALWSTQYDRAGGGWDDGRGVAVGADGSVYVVGSTDVTEGFPNLLLRKYR